MTAPKSPASAQGAFMPSAEFASDRASDHGASRNNARNNARNHNHGRNFKLTSNGNHNGHQNSNRKNASKNAAGNNSVQAPRRFQGPDPQVAAHVWLPSQFKDMDWELNIRHIRQHRNDPVSSSANEERKRRSIREYTLGEEVMNSITHGLGALLAVAAIPILVVHAVGDGGGIYLFAALVYTLTMLLEYIMSTLYHAISARKAKRVFKILDHSCIYLFIAGTFTPFCLITLAPYHGVWLFAFIWGVAVAGVACEAFWVFRPRWISAVLYLAMGWSIAGFLPTLVNILTPPALWLLLAGGIAYSIGCVFYVLKKVPYMHSVFHLWVLAGSVLQFLAVALYVI